MAMNFKQILGKVRLDGSVCDRYKAKVDDAGTKSGLMNVLSCIDGVEFMTERLSKDINMDYGRVSDELSPHINGNRVFYRTGYTSEIFIGYNGSIEARTSLLALWGSSLHVTIPDYHYVRIFCDRNTRLDIECGKGSQAVCVYYGALPEASGYGNVKFIKGS